MTSFDLNLGIVVWEPPAKPHTHTHSLALYAAYNMNEILVYMSRVYKTKFKNVLDILCSENRTPTAKKNPRSNPDESDEDDNDVIKKILPNVH